MPATTGDYVKLHFIVLVWGFTAILGLLINLPPIEMVLYRTFISAVALGSILFINTGSIKVQLRGFFQLISTGFIIAAHWILFFAAARVSTASLCLAGMATAALWTSILEPIVFRKRVRFFEIVLALLTIIGLYVVLKFEFDNALGLLMAIISALLASVFTIINVKMVQHYNHYTITFYEMVGACIGTILFLPIYVTFFSETSSLNLVPSVADIGWLLILALVCTVYPFAVSVELMKRINAFAMNLTINMEPVYGIVMAYLVFGDREKMSSGFYWGTLIIMISVLAYPIVNRMVSGIKSD